MGKDYRKGGLNYQPLAFVWVNDVSDMEWASLNSEKPAATGFPWIPYSY